MKGVKIFNDPVYGFVKIPKGLILDIIDHPYFQRLRRIKQLSLTHYVYPGALHTRFHHALGAFHLMMEAMDVLRSKGIDISDEEVEGAGIAILLHDIGHGPFSHTLENLIIKAHHEEVSLLFMEHFNKAFDGRLTLAIEIFKGTYHKPFLHQLVSGQLDADRLDYLNRDSFFTGVHEGVIGYDRIIHMLNVQDGQLVVEEKGMYSIEKFLVARRLMYWQVYLHKTVLSAELMLIATMQRAKQLVGEGASLDMPMALDFFMQRNVTMSDFQQHGDKVVEQFAQLDDYDIFSALKSFARAEDGLLRYLAEALLNRKLFRLQYKNTPFSEVELAERKEKVAKKFPLLAPYIDLFVKSGLEQNTAYKTSADEIHVLFKNGSVRPASQSADHGIVTTITQKYYLWYPKF